MMSTIFAELALISPMVATTSPTTSPPLTAIVADDCANPLACRAFSEFCRTVPVNSSMLAAVS